MKNRLSLLALPLLLAGLFGPVQAAPQAPQVVNGQATFTQQGNVFSITNTPGAIINWQSFSVGQGEITRFLQQHGGSAVLNRIVGQDPSQILGALQSNGHVFLINPNGIVFGKDARIDVNGLTASTLGLSDADFLAGKRNFQGASAAKLANEGAITTPTGGKVFLIAQDVKNSGIINAPGGEVVLAAGHSVQLVDSGNPDLHVVVSAPLDAAVNLGKIISAGGKVGIYGALVNQRGSISADSAQIGANGKIVLRASRDSVLDAGSVTSATGAGQGGAVHVLGQRVALRGDALIDASGAAGGGTVLVGGDYQGRNALIPQAQQTVFGKNALIRADAGASGNGGTVVLWSTGSTRSHGQLSAKGGSQGGNGGLIETSGAFLDVEGLRVYTGAPKGAYGTWLLDPYDIEINASAPYYIGLGDVDQFSDEPVNGTTSISPTVFAEAPQSTNIVLQAIHDVRFVSPLSRAAGSTGSLTVQAGHDIIVDAPINTMGGALTLEANSMSAGVDGGGAGTLRINAGIDTMGGALTGSGYGIVLNSVPGPFSASNKANTGSGDMSFFTSNFMLGSGYGLQSAGRIDVRADSAQLLGSIGPAGGVKPIVNIAPRESFGSIEVSTAVPESSGLHLLPAQLNAIEAQLLILGSPSTDSVRVRSPLGGVATPMRSDSLLLTAATSIFVDAAITLPTGINSQLALVRNGAEYGGVTIASGGLTADNIILRSDAISIDAPVSATDGILVQTDSASAGIAIGTEASSGEGVLGLLNADLARLSAPRVAIAADSGLTLSSTLDLSGALGSTSELNLDAGSGDLELYAPLKTGGNLFLKGQRLLNTESASITAPSIFASASGAIGGANPFYTQTSALVATNLNPGGSTPINIENTGNLVLGSVSQRGAGNNGSISVLNYGEMTLLPVGPDGKATVISTAGGAISLATRSPLTIGGSVNSNGGPIALEAGNGGTLTITSDGTVSSGAGDISLTGGSVINDGSVASTSGDIAVDGPLSGTGTLASVSGNVTGLPPPVLTLEGCLANPTATGCSVVLAEALASCIANPAQNYCAAVLPTLSACIAKPNTPGCSAVLPTLAVCIADPATPGCSAVLPSAATCAAAPSTPGCAALLPTLEFCIANPNSTGCGSVLPALTVCIANPATPGCSVVLPTLATCTANPATPGCSVVLPSLATCTANPAAPGCSAVLPSLTTCIANPAAPGCSAVLPSLATCTANPATPGCSAVLPSLTVCTANPATPGCSAVLPSLTTCTANPATPGCSAVLPSLNTCVAAPATAGCSAVLPSLNTCIAAPGTPGCQAVLPTLAQCVAAPATAGCSAVLPTLPVCISNPSTAGCSVVLPSLAVCIGAPSTPGCSAVLPTLAACIANPAAPGCAVVLPSLNACVVGSSRVDLQACKLEYSIVSPK